jgi:hypothetical protein
MPTLTLRLLDDPVVILVSSTGNTYNCIAHALEVPLQATPNTRLYKMDLYLLDGTLDFSKSTYKRALQSTLSDKHTGAADDYSSIFLYLPNIKEINLNGCSVYSQQYVVPSYRKSFDFSNCAALEALNMS